MAKKGLSTDKKAVVDKLALTIATTLQAVGQDTGGFVWPSPVLHPVEADLYAAQLMLILYKKLLQLKEMGLSEMEIARLFKAPSRIAQLCWLISGLGLTKLSKREKIDLTYRIVKLISVFREDPFCKDGRNILWSKKEFEKRLDEIKWNELGRAHNPVAYCETINKLSGLAWLYCELLFFYMHGIGHEFHGPYLLPKRQILVVREFYDLKPEFLPFTRNLPFNRVVIFSIYENDIDTKFDFFNRTRTKENLAPYLKKVAVELDSQRFLSRKGTQRVITDLERVINAGVKEMSKMDKIALLKKIAEAYFFIIKPLCEKLGTDWLPPKSLYESIGKEDKKEIFKAILKDLEKGTRLSKGEYIKVTAQAYNPRF